MKSFGIYVALLALTADTVSPLLWTATPTRPFSRTTSLAAATAPKNLKPEAVVKVRKGSLPRRAVKIYTQYARRLWNETNADARRKISGDRVSHIIRDLRNVVGDSSVVVAASHDTKQRLVDACDQMLDEMANAAVKSASTSIEVNKATSSSGTKKKERKQRSVMFGAAMGLAVAGWVFSGNYIFAGLFTLMTILGQLEYYRMVINTGVYPARRISVIGACSMFLTALFTPDLHQICLPMFGLWSMIWFLTMKRTVTTIPEIATTFTGMFYLGYVPSFWVRIRLLGGGREPTRLAPLAAPVLRFVKQKAESTLPSFVPQAVHLPITTGAIFIFWTWLCLAFSDVGAYFVGKNFGATKLAKVSPAAGATSPNKTVEGVIGGCATSAVLGVIGAWVQRWPYFAITGAVHGLCLGLIGLIGDLTASMLKRDAGLKDFGDILPEHGGILDRVDSFVWTAPYSWLVAAYIIPALKGQCR